MGFTQREHYIESLTAAKMAISEPQKVSARDLHSRRIIAAPICSSSSASSPTDDKTFKIGFSRFVHRCRSQTYPLEVPKLRSPQGLPAGAEDRCSEPVGKSQPHGRVVLSGQNWALSEPCGAGSTTDW
jgi:hypothetical protein